MFEKRTGQCQPCPANQYSLKGMLMCLPRPTCTALDYTPVFSECRASGKRDKFFEWLLPKICMEGISLPPQHKDVDCAPCEQGQYRQVCVPAPAPAPAPAPVPAPVQSVLIRKERRKAVFCACRMCVCTHSCTCAHTRTLSCVPACTRSYAHAHLQGAECRNCPIGHFGHGDVHEVCEVCPAGSHAPLEKHVTVFEHKLPEGFTTVRQAYFFLKKSRHCSI